MRTTNTRVILSGIQSVDSTATATAASWVWDSDNSTRSTRNSPARLAASPVRATSGRPSGARITSMSRQPIPRAASLPCSALYTASFAARRTATCSAGSGRDRQYSASAGVSNRSNTCAPLSASIARAREISTRSTPTPTALTVYGVLEAEARGEPCGGGHVSAENEAKPDEHDTEGNPEGDDRPERWTPGGNRLDLRTPAAPFFLDLRFEREPRGFQTTRDGAQGFLPGRMRVFLEHRRSEERRVGKEC